MNKHKFCVAPMMRYTDLHDRYLLRLISKKTFLYTEMITTNSIVHGNCLYQLNFNHEEHPVGVQFGGNDPKDLIYCSQIAEEYGYDEINLNIGCPSDRVKKGKFGACLMKEPDLVAECAHKIISKVNIPVTIKTRLGVDNFDSYEFLHNFIAKVSSSGVHTVIIHARKALLSGLSPRQNRSVPPLNYKYVYQLKQDFSHLEIIINGGIKSIEEAQSHLEKVDGVMLGREVYTNPFLLKDVDEKIFGEVKQNINEKEVLENYLDYVIFMKNKGFNSSIMLKHIFGLKKGQTNAKVFRKTISNIIANDSIDKEKNVLIDLI